MILCAALTLPSMNLADPGPDLVPSFQSFVNDLFANVLEIVGKGTKEQMKIDDDVDEICNENPQACQHIFWMSLRYIL